MRVLVLPTAWTIGLDILAWFIFHLAVVRVMLGVPRRRFEPEGRLFRPRKWEREGRVYQEVFRIKRWKPLLPDGARWFDTGGFPKKTLAARDVPYLQAFAVETCRAELTHWTIILLAPFFFFWNKPVVGWVMIAYALAENLPLIMAQRFNRARIVSLLQRSASESLRR